MNTPTQGRTRRAKLLRDIFRSICNERFDDPISLCSAVADSFQVELTIDEGRKLYDQISKVYAQWLTKADRAIEREAQICFDVCDDCGQMFANVKHMTWFREAVANALRDGI